MLLCESERCRAARYFVSLDLDESFIISQNGIRTRIRYLRSLGMMSASSLHRFFAVPDRDPLIKMFVKDVAMWWIDSPIVVL